MAGQLDDISLLSEKIGPRPAGTEEEQQAALHVAEELQQGAGFSTVIEDFACVTNPHIVKTVCFGVAFIAALLPIFFPIIAIPAFILGAIAAALFLCEIFGKPLLSAMLRSGVSQNVVAKYQPGGKANAPVRSRKVILVANYDSGKTLSPLERLLGKYTNLANQIAVGGLALAPVILLIRALFFFSATGTAVVVFNVLTIICLVAMALPLAIGILSHFAPYNAAANNNAAGAAVLLDVARQVGNGLVSIEEAEAMARAEKARVHGEAAAREAGVVPEGAELEYEASTGEPILSKEESLAAAKAAIAALTGKPVADKVPMTDIASKLVRPGQEGDVSVRFETEDGPSSAVRHQVEEQVREHAREAAAEEAREGTAGADGAGAQGGLAAEVGAEGSADAAAQVGVPAGVVSGANAVANAGTDAAANGANADAAAEESFIKAPPTAQTTSAPVRDSVPAWAKKAQAKAHKNKPDIDREPKAARSRFADTVAAQIASSQRVVNALTGQVSGGTASSAGALAGTAADAAASTAASVASGVAGVLAASVAEGQEAAAQSGGRAISFQPPAQPMTELQARIAELQAQIDAAAATTPHLSEEAKAAIEQMGAKPKPAPKKKPKEKPQAVSETEQEAATSDTAATAETNAAKEPTGSSAAEDIETSPVALAEIQEAIEKAEDNLAGGAVVPAPKETSKVSEKTEGNALNGAVIPVPAEIPDPANQAEDNLASRTDAPTPVEISGPTEETEENLVDESDEATDAPASPILGMEDMASDLASITGSFAAVGDGAAGGESVDRQIIVLPDVAAVHDASEDTKQRAPMAETTEDTRAGAKALLSNMLPRIGEADLVEQEKADIGNSGVLAPLSYDESDEARTTTAVNSDNLDSSSPSGSSDNNADGNKTTALAPLNVEVEDAAAVSGARVSPISLPSVDTDVDQGAVSSTSSFATAGGTGAFPPITEELVANMAPEERYVDDADDSVFEQEHTETGAFAGPGYVEMPKSRAGRLFGRFFSKKKKGGNAEPGVREWVGADEDYEARSVGKERGSWESFRDDVPENDAFEDEFVDIDVHSTNQDGGRVFGGLGSPNTDAEMLNADATETEDSSQNDGRESNNSEPRGWSGGAFSLGGLSEKLAARKQGQDQATLASEDGNEAETDGALGDAANSMNSSAEDGASASVIEDAATSASESVAPDAPDSDQATQRELNKLSNFRHPGIDTEVWFVLLGSSQGNNCGIEAFISEHRDELRGAIFVNLEALGAGQLTFLQKEGMYRTKTASSRMKRLLRGATEKSGVTFSTSEYTRRDTPAAYAMKHGLSAMTLAGMDGGDMAQFGRASDTMENINEQTLTDNASFVMALLKSI